MSVSSDKVLGVVAAGIVGHPALADWLLMQMESRRFARHAGAAFCLMTGRDLRRDDLDGPPLEVHATDVTDENALQEEPAEAEENVPHVEVDAGGLDDLVWPDARRVGQWWLANRDAFAPEVRYLAGLPIRRPELTQVLRTGNQQQRAAAALELALLYPDAPLLDVTAPAHRQI
jgi:uncharacterized protein (TIGR02270 family)